MMAQLRLLFVCLALLALPGCSFNRTAVSAAGGLLGTAALEVETESNWGFIQESLPGTLKLLEGLLHASPENEDLLVTLTKGWTAMGFGVYETLYLADQVADTGKTGWKSQTDYAYSKALGYGFRWLAAYDIGTKNLIRQARAGTLGAWLDGRLDGDDDQHVTAVAYTGLSWMFLINLNRDKPMLTSQLFVVEGLMNWACAKRPDFENGICQIFRGAWETTRPKMLGGNPAKGKRLFKAAIKQWPDNYMVRMFYLQFSVIPALDEKEYKNQKAFFIKAMRREKADLYVPGQSPVMTTGKKPAGQFFNAIALKRMRILIRYEKELF